MFQIGSLSQKLLIRKFYKFLVFLLYNYFPAEFDVTKWVRLCKKFKTSLQDIFLKEGWFEILVNSHEITVIKSFFLIVYLYKKITV